MNPGLGRSPGEGKGYSLQYSDLENSTDCIVLAVSKSRTRLNDFHFHFTCGLAGKVSACNVGDLGLNPGLGRSPGEGKGYPLQYSGLENSIDCIVHGVAKSRTRLSGFHFSSPHFTPQFLFVASFFLRGTCFPSHDRGLELVSEASRPRSPQIPSGSMWLFLARHLIWK